MAQSSRKTFWLIIAVLVLIIGQVAVLGFIVSRFVNSRQVAQVQARQHAQVQAQLREQQFREQSRRQGEGRRFEEPVARPIQDPARKNVSAPKTQQRPKPTGPRAEPPQFSRTGGIFTNAVVISLSSKATNGVIRYTLDGSEPDESSQVYSGPITIKFTAVMRATVFQPGLAPSVTVTHTYSLLGDDLKDFTSNLPLVVLNHFNQRINYNGYVPGSARFIDLGANGRASLFGEADYDGRIDIKRRGYSSLRFPKQSFTIKTRDDEWDKVKVGLYDLPSESDWVLYAPYADKTLIRDVLAYELSNQMGRYAPRTKFVEVFLHNSSGPVTYRDYQGVYVLVEKIKRGKSRVNIEKLSTNDLTEPNISGGYILKRDHGSMSGGGWRGGGSPPRPANDGIGFKTPRGLHLFFVDPEEDELTASQRQWVSRYFNEFERTLYGSKFADPIEGYAKYLDVDAFIDHFWLTEMTKNVDAFRYSAYLHKPRGGKITMGPAWDWNLSFGNADYYDAHETSGWYYENLRDIEISWIERLREDPEFRQRMVDRWAELRGGPFATDKMLARVDQFRNQLQESQQRNFRKWQIMGRFVRPNHFVGPTYESEINWMKVWIKDRGNWLDRQFLRAPKLAQADGSISLTSTSGDIYYTLNGTDPRAVGGGVAKGAIKYTGSLKLEKNAKLFARVQRQQSWSAPTKLTGN